MSHESRSPDLLPGQPSAPLGSHQALDRMERDTGNISHTNEQELAAMYADLLAEERRLINARIAEQDSQGMQAYNQQMARIAELLRQIQVAQTDSPDSVATLRAELESMLDSPAYTEIQARVLTDTPQRRLSKNLVDCKEALDLNSPGAEIALIGLFANVYDRDPRLMVKISTRIADIIPPNYQDTRKVNHARSAILALAEKARLRMRKDGSNMDRLEPYLQTVLKLAADEQVLSSAILYLFRFSEMTKALENIRGAADQAKYFSEFRLSDSALLPFGSIRTHKRFLQKLFMTKVSLDFYESQHNHSGEIQSIVRTIRTNLSNLKISITDSQAPMPVSDNYNHEIALLQRTHQLLEVLARHTELKDEHKQKLNDVLLSGLEGSITDLLTGEIHAVNATPQAMSVILDILAKTPGVAYTMTIVDEELRDGSDTTNFATGALGSITEMADSEQEILNLARRLSTARTLATKAPPWAIRLEELGKFGIEADHRNFARERELLWGVLPLIGIDRRDTFEHGIRTSTLMLSICALMNKYEIKGVFPVENPELARLMSLFMLLHDIGKNGTYVTSLDWSFKIQILLAIEAELTHLENAKIRDDQFLEHGSQDSRDSTRREARIDLLTILKSRNVHKIRQELSTLLRRQEEAPIERDNLLKRRNSLQSLSNSLKNKDQQQKTISFIQAQILQSVESSNHQRANELLRILDLGGSSLEQDPNQEIAIIINNISREITVVENALGDVNFEISQLEQNISLARKALGETVIQRESQRVRNHPIKSAFSILKALPAVMNEHDVKAGEISKDFMAMLVGILLLHHSPNYPSKKIESVVLELLGIYDLKETERETFLHQTRQYYSILATITDVIDALLNKRRYGGETGMSDRQFMEQIFPDMPQWQRAPEMRQEIERILTTEIKVWGGRKSTLIAEAMSMARELTQSIIHEMKQNNAFQRINSGNASVEIANYGALANSKTLDRIMRLEEQDPKKIFELFIKMYEDILFPDRLAQMFGDAG